MIVNHIYHDAACFNILTIINLIVYRLNNDRKSYIYYDAACFNILTIINLIVYRLNNDRKSYILR